MMYHQMNNVQSPRSGGSGGGGYGNNLNTQSSSPQRGLAPPGYIRNDLGELPHTPGSKPSARGHHPDPGPPGLRGGADTRGHHPHLLPPRSGVSNHGNDPRMEHPATYTRPPLPLPHDNQRPGQTRPPYSTNNNNAPYNNADNGYHGYHNSGSPAPDSFGPRRPPLPSEMNRKQFPSPHNYPDVPAASDRKLNSMSHIGREGMGQSGLEDSEGFSPDPQKTYWSKPPPGPPGYLNNASAFSTPPPPGRQLDGGSSHGSMSHLPPTHTTPSPQGRTVVGGGEWRQGEESPPIGSNPPALMNQSAVIHGSHSRIAATPPSPYGGSRLSTPPNPHQQPSTPQRPTNFTSWSSSPSLFTPTPRLPSPAKGAKSPPGQVPSSPHRGVPDGQPRPSRSCMIVDQEGRLHQLDMRADGLGTEGMGTDRYVVSDMSRQASREQVNGNTFSDKDSDPNMSRSSRGSGEQLNRRSYEQLPEGCYIGQNEGVYRVRKVPTSPQKPQHVLDTTLTQTSYSHAHIPSSRAFQESPRPPANYPLGRSQTEGEMMKINQSPNAPHPSQLKQYPSRQSLADSQASSSGHRDIGETRQRYSGSSLELEENQQRSIRGSLNSLGSASGHVVPSPGPHFSVNQPRSMMIGQQGHWPKNTDRLGPKDQDSTSMASYGSDEMSRTRGDPPVPPSEDVNKVRASNPPPPIGPYGNDRHTRSYGGQPYEIDGREHRASPSQSSDAGRYGQPGQSPHSHHNLRPYSEQAHHENQDFTLNSPRGGPPLHQPLHVRTSSHSDLGVALPPGPGLLQPGRRPGPTPTYGGDALAVGGSQPTPPVDTSTDADGRRRADRMEYGGPTVREGGHDVYPAGYQYSRMEASNQPAHQSLLHRHPSHPHLLHGPHQSPPGQGHPQGHSPSQSPAREELQRGFRFEPEVDRRRGADDISGAEEGARGGGGQQGVMAVAGQQWGMAPPPHQRVDTTTTSGVANGVASVLPRQPGDSLPGGAAVPSAAAGSAPLRQQYEPAERQLRVGPACPVAVSRAPGATTPGPPPTDAAATTTNNNSLLTSQSSSSSRPPAHPATAASIAGAGGVPVGTTDYSDHYRQQAAHHLHQQSTKVPRRQQQPLAGILTNTNRPNPAAAAAAGSSVYTGSSSYGSSTSSSHGQYAASGRHHQQTQPQSSSSSSSLAAAARYGRRAHYDASLR